MPITIHKSSKFVSRCSLSRVCFRLYNSNCISTYKCGSSSVRGSITAMHPNRPLSTRVPALRIPTCNKGLKCSPCQTCSYLQIPGGFCDHETSQYPRRSNTPHSDCSFYTAPMNQSWTVLPQCSDVPLSPATSVASDASEATSTSFSSGPGPKRTPSLRRTRSPTETSLRDIRKQQARLQAMQSEDQLRSAYERQTSAYLDSAFASLDTLNE